MLGAGSGVAVFLLVVAVGLTVLLVLLGAGDRTDQPAAASGDVLVATEFAYDPGRIESGTEVELTLRNDGAVYHDLVIEGVDGFQLTALPGETDQGSVSLDPGRYVMYCTVPGHRDSGMVAELAVG
jgi:plastocyanin